jgi:hypothetical protein
LSSSRLGLIAKLDLVEGEGDTVTPVDYKRGKRPHVPKAAYDPERVELCVRGMILVEHGYRCEAGILYFAASRERVRVALDQELRAMTLAAVNDLRLVAAGARCRGPAGLVTARKRRFFNNQDTTVARCRDARALANPRTIYRSTARITPAERPAMRVSTRAVFRGDSPPPH